MKILQIGKFYPIRGGVEKVMYDLTLGLSEIGVRCDMLCTVTEGQKPGIIPLNAYARLLCMPVLLKLSATMISPVMIGTLRKIGREYDIIHIHHPDPMACTALFLSGYKGKVVLHWHSDILKQKTLLKLYRPLQRWLIDRADLIVGTTPVYVQQSPFLQQFQEKITDIPIGIESQPEVTDAANRVKARYPDRKIVFSLGRLVEYKGYEYLIKAARYLDDDYIILIGGSGPLKGELQRLIDKLGLCGKVQLLGFVPDEEVAAYYRACDLFCLSSIWKTEAFGIVQIEAMSCGKPVVATLIDGSGVSWVNADGVTGYNVKPRNAEVLAAAIRKILADPYRYADLAENARRRYEALFTRDYMVEHCVEQYNDLLRRPFIIPNEPFFRVVKRFLDEGKEVRIPVKGNSMCPFLREGDTVLLAPVNGRRLRSGMVVLARTNTGEIVLHRVAFRWQERLWLLGDANSLQREQSAVENVMAVAVAAFRGNRNLKTARPRYRCAVAVWTLILPFRGLLLWIYDMKNRKKQENENKGKFDLTPDRQRVHHHRTGQG